jgi:lysophospholipase L1-like esterase
MRSDPSQITVVPIPFEHGLTHFAQSLTSGRAKIVAIGSSTTAGEGNIKAYPERLLSFLQAEYPGTEITMVNKGIGGQEAPIEFRRFGTDVIAEKPDLVIWQVGTNAVWQSPDQNPPPPSFDETTRAIHDGLVKLRDDTQADVILMDLQYVPAVLTPAKRQGDRDGRGDQRTGAGRRRQCVPPLRIHEGLASGRAGLVRPDGRPDG